MSLKKRFREFAVTNKNRPSKKKKLQNLPFERKVYQNYE
jgi:hypothetical protein